MTDLERQLQLKQEIVDHLRALGTGKVKPISKVVGICRELTNKFSIPGVSFIANRAEGWSEFSGERAFPIKHDEKECWSAYITARNLWGKTKYGDSRRALCLYIADVVEQEIANEDYSL